MYPAFGYVQSARRVPYRGAATEGLGEMDRTLVASLETVHRKLNEAAVGKGLRPREPLQHLLTYTVRVKDSLAKEGLHLATDRHVTMKVLARVKTELRKFEALLHVPQCKLVRELVSPSSQHKSFQPGLASEHLHPRIKDLPQLQKLNSSQRRTIVSVSRACLEGPEVPKVSLVQGPPGTGKSSTLTGLVLHLLYSRLQGERLDSMPRLLVVAPSNAAVDELAIKLIEARGMMPEKLRFRLVRLGMEKSMKEAVKEYSFDCNVARVMREDTRKSQLSQSLENDRRSKQQQANALFAAKQSAEEEGNTDLAAKLGRDYKEKQQQVRKIEAQLKQPLDHRAQRDMRRSAVERVMVGADVLLSTLSSCLGGEVERFLVHQSQGTSRGAGSMRPVSVCIMDEASQCVEPEALIPLKLGFCKLVMVGCCSL